MRRHRTNRDDNQDASRDANPNVAEAEARADVRLRAVITRADGTVQDLGLIGHQSRRLHRRLWWWCIGRLLAERRIRRANRTVRS